MTIGEKIYELRKQKGLSQEELGYKLNVTRQTVSKWELDQVYPEIEKIVLISKIFKVTTDSLLIDGIDTFDVKYDNFVCGVYKSKHSEIVVTNKYTLYFYATSQHIFGVKLYQGFETNKSLIAIVERDDNLEKTKYAYKLEDKVYYNDENIKKYPIGNVVNGLPIEFNEVPFELVMDACLDTLGVIDISHLTLNFIVKLGLYFTQQEMQQPVNKLYADNKHGLYEKDPETGKAKNRLDVIKRELKLNPAIEAQTDKIILNYIEKNTIQKELFLL